MAENKNSFILYSDLIKTVSKLPKEKAGELFLIILEYVNDLNPEPEDILLQIAFEPIKNQLKRDLSKWENLREKRSEAGKASAEKRKQNSTNPTSVESVEQSLTNPTVSVTVNANVNDTVTVNDILLKKETKVNNIDIRKLKFSYTLEPFLNTYGKDLLNDFYKYWTEPNKSNTKFKQEMEKTWSLERRLETWAKNDKNFNNGKKSINTGAKLTAAEKLERLKQDFSNRLDESVKGFGA